MTDNDNSNDYLTRLFDYMRLTTPKAILEAERAMLLEEIKNITAERDAAVASTVAAFEPELTFRRERLSVIDSKIAGEQVSLFKIAPVRFGAFDAVVSFGADPEIKCGTDFDATNGPVKDSPLNAAMNYAAKYPPPQEPTGPVIPCSTDNKDTGNEPETYFNTPKNAQVVTRDGQTFFVFRSAGYKAIAERLGFLYRPMLDGSKGYMLTPKEYDEVFAEHQKAVKYRKEMKDFKL